jgi:PGF-CTERM protein
MSRTLGTVLVVVVLASLATPAAVAATQEQEQVTLTVSVVDRAGERVSGATLTAGWDGGEATETTRSNGQALVDVPRGANVSLDVEADDYVRNVPKVVAAGDGGAVTFEVARVGSATVRAETADGEALADARVTLARDGTTVAEGTTNANGGFFAENIERGRYDVEVVKPGYYAVERTLTVESSFAIQSATLEEGEVTARFRVVDDHFAEPRALGAATVRVGSLGTFNTSDDGTRAVSVPVNAEFDVRVTKAGYTTTTSTVTIGESDGTTTLAVQRTPTLTLEPSNTRVVVGQTVEVRVTDEYDDAVGNATLRVDGEAVGETGADGRARIPIDTAGEHDVTAAVGDRTSAAVVVEGVEAARATTAAPTTVVETETPTPEATVRTTTETSSGSGPGFGVGLALVAALLATALLARRG